MKGMRRMGRGSVGVRATSDAGFGLLEVIISLFILALVLSGVAYGLTQQIRTTLDSRNREVAASLAAGALDQARAVDDFATIDGAEWTQVVNGQTFTILQTVTPYLVTATTTSPCDGSSSGAIAYKRVSVRVSWEDMGGTAPVRSDTLITPSQQNYDPTKGNLGVRVRDAGAAGVEGIQATVSRSGFSATAFTDESGCAFFDALTPATYTIAVNEPGYVDWQGVTNPTKTASAIAGSTAGVAFDYDRAATLQLNLPSGAYPVVSASLPMWIGNTALTPNGTKQFTGSGVSRTITGLFPFPSGYTAWNGTCTDANPLSDFPAIPVSRGQTTVSDVPMAAVKVTVRKTVSGDPVPGATVTVFHVATTGETACPTTGSPSYPVGATDANGEVKVAMPWGTWRFTATTAGASQVQAVLDSPNTDEVVLGVTVP